MPVPGGVDSDDYLDSMFDEPKIKMHDDFFDKEILDGDPRFTSHPTPIVTNVTTHSRIVPSASKAAGK